MSGRVSVCSIKPNRNEQIDAVIKIKKENRSALYGTVVDENNQPVADAVVKLLQVCGKCIVPLTHTFTDQRGQFLLGPLSPNQRYMLKIFKDNICIRYERINASCYEGNSIESQNGGTAGATNGNGGRCRCRCDCYCNRDC